MPRYERAEIGVKGLIFRRGRLLLLHRRTDLAFSPNLWDLPGGGVERGDNLEGSLVREVREETGFPVRIGLPVHASIVRARSISGRRLTVVIVYYRCSTRATGEPRLDPLEHTDFAWVGRDEMGRYPTAPDQLVPIRRAFATP